MSWLERLDAKRHALKVARLEGERWSSPATVALGDSFFVNWADFPILLALDARRLVVTWPWKHKGGDVYAYDVRMSFSRDGGRTWSRPTLPHRDDTPTEHGFVALALEGEGVRAVWLDGRRAIIEKLHAEAHGGKAAATADGDAAGKESGAGEEHGHGEMALFTAWIGLDGSLAHEGQLDARVCDCCQTAAVATPAGVVVAYRDRAPDETRDISVLRMAGGSRWSPPVTLHPDGWVIEGCPVNGPALDASGARVAAAWFTQARDTARVRVAFSGDGGLSFGPPVQVDGGNPLGRADVALLADGSALVSWLEQLDAQRAEVRVRRVGPDGALGAPLTVAGTAASRASGFPRLARQGERAVVAWTATGPRPRVRAAALPLPPLERPLSGSARR
jgi:hypothetical protein